MEENKKLSQGLEKYTKEQNQYVHKKEDVGCNVTFYLIYFILFPNGVHRFCCFTVRDKLK